MERLQTMFDKFKRDLDKYQTLVTLEAKTTVPKEYIVIGAGVTVVLALFLGFGAGLICNLVGFAAPAYFSFQAIESKSKEDDKQWLTYWVIFAAFSILEVFVASLLYWIPFYFAIKSAFLMWCMLPQTRGATFLYDAVLKDIMKTPSNIDKAASSRPS